MSPHLPGRCPGLCGAGLAGRFCARSALWDACVACRSKNCYIIPQNNNDSIEEYPPTSERSNLRNPRSTDLGIKNAYGDVDFEDVARNEDIVRCDFFEVVFRFLAAIIPRSVDLGFFLRCAMKASLWAERLKLRLLRSLSVYTIGQLIYHCL